MYVFFKLLLLLFRVVVFIDVIKKHLFNNDKMVLLLSQLITRRTKSCLLICKVWGKIWR